MKFSYEGEGRSSSRLAIMYLKWRTVLILTVINCCTCANILMITMGGTKSHKIPFFELAKGLIPRGHNITFLNAFPSDFYMEGNKFCFVGWQT